MKRFQSLQATRGRGSPFSNRDNVFSETGANQSTCGPTRYASVDTTHTPLISYHADLLDFLQGTSVEFVGLRPSLLKAYSLKNIIQIASFFMYHATKLYWGVTVQLHAFVTVNTMTELSRSNVNYVCIYSGLNVHHTVKCLIGNVDYIRRVR